MIEYSEPRGPSPDRRAPQRRRCTPVGAGIEYNTATCARQPRGTAGPAQLRPQRCPEAAFFLCSINVASLGQDTRLEEEMVVRAPGSAASGVCELGRGTATAVHGRAPGHTMELLDSGGALPWASSRGSSFATEPGARTTISSSNLVSWPRDATLICYSHQ